MSYNRSKQAIIRVEHILRDLVNAQDDCVFQSLEPAKLAYNIHEAFKSATIFPEYASYASLGTKFKIRLRQGKVVAELRSKQVLALRIVQDQLSKMVLDSIENVMGIVGACVTHKATEMYFPNAHLTENELVSLLAWATPAGYFIINNDDAGVTLTKTNPGEMTWSPNGNVHNS